MLASFLRIALQVTDGVSAYAARWAAIESFYAANADGWLDVADLWTYDSVCGAKYYGTHIAFEPGKALDPIDVGARPVDDYLWQNGPWNLTSAADLAHTYPGVDYLIAYWLGRHHGFIAPDDVAECLRWRSGTDG
jgi:hypothetical protein